MISLLILLQLVQPSTSQSCATNVLWYGSGGLIQPSGAINQCVPYASFMINWTYDANQNDTFEVWGGQNYCNTSFQDPGRMCGGIQRYSGLQRNAGSTPRCASAYTSYYSKVVMTCAAGRSCNQRYTICFYWYTNEGKLMDSKDIKLEFLPIPTNALFL